MTQIPDDQSTAEFQAQLGEQEPDQDSGPTTMAPQDESPVIGSQADGSQSDGSQADGSQAQEPDDAPEASPS